MNFDKKRYFANSKLGWGFILVFFGLLMFMYRKHIFAESNIYNVKFFPVYAGIIFLLTRNLWSSAVSFLIAALVNFTFVASTFKTYSDLVLPIGLVAAGLVIIYYNFTKK